MLHISFGHVRSSEGVSKWHKMVVFRKLINHHKNAIQGSVFRKTFHKIQRNDLPSMIRHMQGLKHTRVPHMLIFSLLAHKTSLYKLGNSGKKARPSKQLLGALIGDMYS